MYKCLYLIVNKKTIDINVVINLYFLQKKKHQESRAEGRGRFRIANWPTLLQFVCLLSEGEKSEQANWS